jgi:AcrR family transcriptional regulator
MIRSPRNKKDDLIAAAVRLVAERGVRGATIRSIAREAGVTEGALYRHYRTKDDLCLDIYKRIVEDMIQRKEHLVSGADHIRDRLREWVRLSYEYFDRDPDAFTYVLLTPHDFPEAERTITARQGRLFIEMIRQAMAARQIRPISPALALSHFSGLMLNVPRLISQGALPGPASQYADHVADAVWRVLRAET